jgi:hypothetical protein
MHIKLETMGGEEISDCFQKAIDLANRIQFDVEFKFNGVTCFVKPGGSVRKGVEEWNDALKIGNQHKFARSY